MRDIFVDFKFGTFKEQKHVLSLLRCIEHLVKLCATHVLHHALLRIRHEKVALTFKFVDIFVQDPECDNRDLLTVQELVADFTLQVRTCLNLCIMFSLRARQWVQSLVQRVSFVEARVGHNHVPWAHSKITRRRL